MQSLLTRVLVAVLVLTLAACSSNPFGASDQEIQTVRYGRVEQVTPVTIDSPNKFGIGAILGGAAGAGLGSLIGAGTGRDVAIAVGALAGAVGGSYAQSRASTKNGLQIVVRTDSGVLVVVTQPADSNIRVGDRVEIIGTGGDATVQRL
jgi:outer membrane lipoprotein SlyB